MNLIDHLGQQTNKPSEEQVLSALQAADESLGRVIQLGRTSEDYIQIERVREGFKIRYCEPKYGERWESRATNLTAEQVMEVVGVYLKGKKIKRVIRWNRWKRKTGCLMVVLFLVLSVAFLGAAACALAESGLR